MHSSTVYNEVAANAVEWAPFVKINEVSDQQLIAAADQVNQVFLSQQPGFIKRELIKKSDTEYADVIHWSSKKDAETAGHKVFDCDQCKSYFALMDTDESVAAGAGFSHYDILKQWG
jgi:hypothetical protein